MVKKILPKNKFWNKKKIFLTGHTSFKGSWLKIWLEHLGSKVYGYSIDYPSKPTCLYKIFYKKKIKSQSILDLNNLKKRIEVEKPEIVFHLAAQSIVSNASKKPFDSYNTNIIGTASVLEACAQSKNTKLVVIVTTDKCYSENQNLKYYTEKSTLGGSEPYSASKAAAELIAKSYYFKYKNLKKKVITLRAGNVIGGGDWKNNRLVPDIVKSIFKNNSLILRNPRFIRPWIHVLDCLNGYLIASEYAYQKNYTFNSWNFAPPLENQVKVYDLAKKMLLKFGKKNKIRLLNKKTFYETKRLNLSSFKAKKELKWRSILNQDNTLGYTCDWYSNYYKKSDMKLFSINQIKSFYKIPNRKKTK